MSTPNPLPYDPSTPMTPELRSDIAYRRANGWSWKDLAGVLQCDADALRRVTENDPEYAPAQERAWAAVTWEGDADAMRRLRQMVEGGDSERALRAAEVLVKYAQERRHDETRLAIEKLRAETRLAVETLRTERAALKQPKDPEPRYAPMLPYPETEEEQQKRFEREHAERAAQPEAYVYIWGGKHPMGRCIAPDETDTRVRVKADWSCGTGKRGTVFWIVPDPPPLAATMPGEPGAAEAFAQCWPGL
jgi:hypothetical protein